jgi:hypothetical protein
MIDLLYIVGAFASILGALLAWRQFANTKRLAEQTRIRIAGIEKIAQLSRLEDQWHDVYGVLAVFAAGARPIDLRGKNNSNAARKAQDYIEAINGASTSLQNINNLGDRLNDAHNVLNEFSCARSGGDLKEKGTALCKKLSELNADITRVLISTRESLSVFT